jgi:hypothetical protein
MQSNAYSPYDDPYEYGADDRQPHPNAHHHQQQQQQQHQPQEGLNLLVPSGDYGGGGGDHAAMMMEAMVNFDDPKIANLPRVLLMGPRRGGKTSIQVRWAVLCCAVLCVLSASMGACECVCVYAVAYWRSPPPCCRPMRMSTVL